MIPICVGQKIIIDINEDESSWEGEVLYFNQDRVWFLRDKSLRLFSGVRSSVVHAYPMKGITILRKQGMCIHCGSVSIEVGTLGLDDPVYYCYECGKNSKCSMNSPEMIKRIHLS